MVDKKEILAIIPARGGSKGIPHKNIRYFAGYPLIGYSIAAGLQSEYVTRVLVSTDDEEIAETAKGFGAEVPFMRPAHLAQDTSLDLPVFQHALTWLQENEKYRPDLVVQLRPTSPIRPIILIDQAIQMMLDHPHADSLRGVVPAGQNPYKMWQIGDEGLLKPLIRVDGLDEPYNSARQELPPVYWQTGHIDVIRTDTILKKGSMSGDLILPFLIEPKYSIDLDNELDWHRNEWYVREMDLDMVYPGYIPRPWPEKVSLVVFDFDGVMTDNSVWVNGEGVESVSANRADGMGIEMLQAAGIRSVIISTEPNPVVAARAKKIGLPYFHGVNDKSHVLLDFLEREKIPAAETIYLGNDVNDLPCFPIVARAFVVADAHPVVKKQADFILTHAGGHGAVRELCDILIERYGN